METSFLSSIPYMNKICPSPDNLFFLMADRNRDRIKYSAEILQTGLSWWHVILSQCEN